MSVKYMLAYLVILFIRHIGYGKTSGLLLVWRNQFVGVMGVIIPWKTSLQAR
jgi:hypothetical protein